MTASVFFSRRAKLSGLMLAFASSLFLMGCNQAEDAQQGMPPAQVAVQDIEPTAVDVYADYPGRTRGAREVEIHARVEGTLLERHYNEGEFVKKGDQLFSIDDRPFKAVVSQRKAEVAQAQARMQEAEQAWRRADSLYKDDAISEAEHDDAKAKIATARAAVALAQANLESAQIDLDYTNVTSPIDGVTSLRENDEGALVTHGSLLTKVTQLDPVHVIFSVPAKDAVMRDKALAAIGQEDGELRSARLIMPSGEMYEKPGQVDFTQSTIDPETGTVRLRAIFDNADRHLIPGRFVRIRIRLETRENAFVVPEIAISDSQDSVQVYVARDGKAKPTPVVLGPKVAEGRIVEKGLSKGDKVIVAGLGHVMPNGDINIVSKDQLEQGGQAAAQ